jgi:tetratricopeptide (TPR) repeat protein
MTTNQPTPDTAGWPRARELYLKILHHFYDRDEPARAVPAALSLLRLLDRLDPAATTLPGNEYRAVIAELDGDLPSAISYREAVVRMLDELAAARRLAETGVSAADYSDQLDLLAILYRRANRLQDAKAVIERSAAVCQKAGVDFDGADVQKDIDRALRNAARATRIRPHKGRLTTGS